MHHDCHYTLRNTTQLEPDLTNKNGISAYSAFFVNSDPRVGIMDKIGNSVDGG